MITKAGNRKSVSVIMPCFNAAGTLRRAVLSTLNSLGPEDELIAIDDGSKDSTQSILNSIEDYRLRVVVNSKNLGIAESLNIGISSAKNEFLARMDADDFCLPWRFRRQMRILENSDLDIIFSSQVFKVGFLYLFPVHTWITRNPDKRNLRALSLTCFYAHPTMLARKSALERVGPYSNSPAEDYELWLRASIIGLKIRRDWFPVNVYTLSDKGAAGSASHLPDHLGHLDNLRTELFCINSEQRLRPSPPEIIKEMRRFRLSLLLIRPILFLELGLSPIYPLKSQSTDIKGNQKKNLGIFWRLRRLLFRRRY